jgi:hypothetical protein
MESLTTIIGDWTTNPNALRFLFIALASGAMLARGRGRS